MSFFGKKPSSRQTITQAVAIGASSTATASPFGSQTYQVRLAATAACYYLVSEAANVVAVTASNGSYLPANWVEYLTVTPGQKLSVIQASAAGTLTVTEMA